MKIKKIKIQITLELTQLKMNKEKFSIEFKENSKTFSLRNLEKNVSIWKNYKFSSFNENEEEAKEFLNFIIHKFNINNKIISDIEFMKTFLKQYQETFKEEWNENILEEIEELEEIKENFKFDDLWIWWIICKRWVLRCWISSNDYSFEKTIKHFIGNVYWNTSKENLQAELLSSFDYRKFFEEKENLQEFNKNFWNWLREEANIEFTLENWKTFNVFKETNFFKNISKSIWDSKSGTYWKYLFDVYFNVEEFEKYLSENNLIFTSWDLSRFNQKILEDFYDTDKELVFNSTVSKWIIKHSWIDKFTNDFFIEKFWEIEDLNVLKNNVNLFQKIQKTVGNNKGNAFISEKLLNSPFDNWAYLKISFDKEVLLNSINEIKTCGLYYNPYIVDNLLNYFKKQWEIIWENSLSRTIKKMIELDVTNTDFNEEWKLNEIIFQTLNKHSRPVWYGNSWFDWWKTINFVFTLVGDTYEFLKLAVDYKNWQKKIIDLMNFYLNSNKNIDLEKVKELIELFEYRNPYQEMYPDENLFETIFFIRNGKMTENFLYVCFLKLFDASKIPNDEFKRFKFLKDNWLNEDFFKKQFWNSLHLFKWFK